MIRFLILILLSLNFNSNNQLYLPKVGNHDTIINHHGFSLHFNHKTHQANWVGYLHTIQKSSKSAERSSNFRADSLIANTNFSIDYKKSGYDKGHLAPAGDMSYSYQAMRESFCYSNVSPQIPGFNRGIWKNLEEQVRSWTQEFDSLYIIVGPVFYDSSRSTTQKIGLHQIFVPQAFFKVILDNHKGHEKMIGFIIPNESSRKSIKEFVLKIDEIEKITKLDFFHSLSDELENRLESEIVLEKWLK